MELVCRKFDFTVQILFLSRLGRCPKRKLAPTRGWVHVTIETLPGLRSGAFSIGRLNIVLVIPQSCEKDKQSLGEYCSDENLA